MRIPASKLYRAFKCLDDFSDHDCEMFMRRVQLSPARNIGLWLVPLATILMGCFISGVVVEAVPFFRPYPPTQEHAKLFFALLTFVGAPLLSALLVRDLLLRQFLLHAIRTQLDRVRCARCKYLLIGRAPRASHVTCPECGLRQSLESLGAEPADLLATSDTQLARTADWAEESSA